MNALLACGQFNRVSATGSTPYVRQGLDARFDAYLEMRARDMDLRQTDRIGPTDGVQMILTEYPDTSKLFGDGPAFSPLASLSKEDVL